MKRRTPFYFLIKSEQERAEFSEAGVDLPKGKMVDGGEFVRFDIAEDVPRWPGFRRIVQKHLAESAARAMGQDRPVPVQPKSSRSRNDQWLDGYSGQTVEELLALGGKYRTESLVLAFEQAIQRKQERDTSVPVTDEERVVLAVEALEREVNNGGYDQFFVNSAHFAPMVVESLQRIGCSKIAKITQRAIQALGISKISGQSISAAMAAEDGRRSARLSRCDDAYYKAAEPIAERLFAFIRTNKASIRF